MLAYGAAVKPHLEERHDLKYMGCISRTTASFGSVGFVLGSRVLGCDICVVSSEHL